MNVGTTAVRHSELKRRIEGRKARVGVIGLGYVGLPLALLYTEERFRVTGFDIYRHKVNALGWGGIYICRIPWSETQSASLHGFSATADLSMLNLDGAKFELPMIVQKSWHKNDDDVHLRNEEIRLTTALRAVRFQKSLETLTPRLRRCTARSHALRASKRSRDSLSIFRSTAR